MLPLMEMLLKSQNGDAFAQLQQQFGLDAAQTEKALEAVMPAFSTGLKRNVSKPQDFGAFMQSLSDGRHGQYIEDPSAAFSQGGVSEGNGILGHLFGSKDVSRAVANHAAQASGVGENVIKKMLPVIASMVMGGLFKQSTGQAQHFGGSAQAVGGGGILGQILGELMKGGTGQQRQQRQAPQRGNNPIGDILEQMMGGGRGQSSQPTGRDNPLGQIFEDMLRGKQGQYQGEEQVRRRSKPSPRGEPEFYEPEDTRQDHYDDGPDDGFEDIGSAERYQRPRTRSINPNGYDDQPREQQKRGGGLEDLFGDMFETGRKVDKGYQGGIESIFDKLLKG